MHVAVSWDINANQPLWGTVNQRLVDCLRPYPWVRPLNTVYVVRVTGEEQRDQILKSLKAVAEAAHVNIDYVVTPVANGHYAGHLSGGVTWAMINDVTG